MAAARSSTRAHRRTNLKSGEQYNHGYGFTAFESFLQEMCQLETRVR